MATTEQTQTTQHSVSVAAVVVDAGKVLVICRRDTGQWEPPGGVLEHDETIQRGLLREVREETGYDVEVEALTGVYKHMRRGIVALVFRCRLVGGSARTETSETRDLRWLDRFEIGTYLSESYAVRVFDALDMTTPAVRAHDGHTVLAR